MSTFYLKLYTSDNDENKEAVKLLQEGNWQQRVYQDLQKAGINLDDVKRIINESLNNYIEELKTTPEAEVGEIWKTSTSE